MDGFSALSSVPAASVHLVVGGWGWLVGRVVVLLLAVVGGLHKGREVIVVVVVVVTGCAAGRLSCG
jgi:hypothetical protein